MEVTVDRSVVENLINSQEAMREFPGLKSLVQSGRSVSRCCGKKATQGSQVQSHVIRAIKNSLMGLPPNKMLVLKRILGADTLVFYTASSSGLVPIRK